MGVKGLTTFLKENRRSLSTSLVLDHDPDQTRGKVPVVVDAWGYVAYMPDLRNHLLMFRINAESSTSSTSIAYRGLRAASIYGSTGS